MSVVKLFSLNSQIELAFFFVLKAGKQALIFKKYVGSTDNVK